MKPRTHWMFGDQLGPHFLTPNEEGPDAAAPLLMIESRSVFRRRVFHRAKAHLILSAMRHRASELGERMRYVRVDSYRGALEKVVRGGSMTVHHPTSRPALDFVESLDHVQVLPDRGFVVPRDAFAAWAGGVRGEHLRMETFYRWVRRSTGLLMDGAEPVGSRWNLDRENREPPPKHVTALGLPLPWTPTEDDIDAEVRADLDRWQRSGQVRFVGRDGPRRFPATRAEALAALRHFLDHRLRDFGRYEDAVLAGDPVMSHSLLSAPLNLGLLHPAECAEQAEQRFRDGTAPLNSVEGFVRQIIGWREYCWHLYWHFGKGYRRRNVLRHTTRLPRWFAELDADAVEARCLSTVLAQVRDTGWTHHIPRLMVLGSYALQRGWHPAHLTDWFHRCFVDGYDWVMLPNVIGMSQYADGGLMTTKPYTSAGAYIDRMSDLCGPCAYRPAARTGAHACPYTVGYWAFVHRHRERLGRNPRVARTVRQLDRLTDRSAVLARHADIGNRPP